MMNRERANKQFVFIVTLKETYFFSLLYFLKVHNLKKSREIIH